MPAVDVRDGTRTSRTAPNSLACDKLGRAGNRRKDERAVHGELVEIERRLIPVASEAKIGGRRHPDMIHEIAADQIVFISGAGRVYLVRQQQQPGGLDAAGSNDESACGDGEGLGAARRHQNAAHRFARLVGTARRRRKEFERSCIQDHIDISGGLQRRAVVSAEIDPADLEDGVLKQCRIERQGSENSGLSAGFARTPDRRMRLVPIGTACSRPGNRAQAPNGLSASRFPANRGAP